MDQKSNDPQMLPCLAALGRPGKTQFRIMHSRQERHFAFPERVKFLDTFKEGVRRCVASPRSCTAGLRCPHHASGLGCPSHSATAAPAPALCIRRRRRSPLQLLWIHPIAKKCVLMPDGDSNALFCSRCIASAGTLRPQARFGGQPGRRPGS